MEKLTAVTERILLERFGGDSLIALATTDGSTPHVRSVDAYFEAGAFYVLTHRLSGKMQQIAANPAVAICGEWFTAHGKGECLGSFGAPENKAIAERMLDVFSAWIYNGHSDLDDPDTCVLRITLTDGVLFSDGRRFEIDFAD